MKAPRPHDAAARGKGGQAFSLRARVDSGQRPPCPARSNCSNPRGLSCFGAAQPRQHDHGFRQLTGPTAMRSIRAPRSSRWRATILAMSDPGHHGPCHNHGPLGAEPTALRSSPRLSSPDPTPTTSQTGCPTAGDEHSGLRMEPRHLPTDRAVRMVLGVHVHIPQAGH
jgi:hypothetical protein